jgi:hypothetical protein
MYDRKCIKNISKFWLKSRIFNLECYCLESDNMHKRIYGRLRLSAYQLLKLIRDYAPDMYNTYELNTKNNKTKKKYLL